jgi:hypothetical protein
LSQTYRDADYSGDLAVNYSGKLSQTNYESQSDIKDWMVDDLAFNNCAENAQIELWMVSNEENKEEWLDETNYNASWFYEVDDLSYLYLADWMVEDQPNIETSFAQNFEEVDMMDWMIESEPFVNEADVETIELQSWMVETGSVENFIDTEIALENWMLDQNYWN